MLERCAAEWGDTTVQALLDLSHTGESGRSFGVHDDRFLAPESVAAQVRDAAGLGKDATPATVVSSILRSIAAAVVSVVDELRAVQPVSELAIVGGGQRHLSCGARSRTLPVSGSSLVQRRRLVSVTRS